MKSEYQKSNERKVRELGLQWTQKAEGAEVLHSTRVNGYRVEVSNFPGSKTLMWRVSGLEEGTWHTEDRFEYTVAMLKLKAVERAKALPEPTAWHEACNKNNARFFQG